MRQEPAAGGRRNSHERPVEYDSKSVGYSHLRRRVRQQTRRARIRNKHGYIGVTGCCLKSRSKFEVSASKQSTRTKLLKQRRKFDAVTLSPRSSQLGCVDTVIPVLRAKCRPNERVCPASRVKAVHSALSPSFEGRQWF